MCKTNNIGYNETKIYEEEAMYHQNNDFQDKDFMMIEMQRQKSIALVAHDNRKNDLVDWVKANKEILSKHFLCGTGTTARVLANATDLPITAFNSGPLGGDQQIGARIVEGKIDFLIFFWDPLAAQPHDPDVKALLRIAALYDIPIATNQSTADFLIASPLMEQNYNRKVIDYAKRLKLRSERFAMDQNIK